MLSNKIKLNDAKNRSHADRFTPDGKANKGLVYPDKLENTLR